MELLDLPIEILFSNIGALTINIPWSKLSSSPVPITLENIYLVIGPKAEKQWNFTDKQGILRKQESIDDYAKQCLGKFAKKKAKSEASEKGYIEKMSVKIIDNIQLLFKNIHVRWEDPVQGFSFGITLQELQANTTDENWKQAFLDRTKDDVVKAAVYKLLTLKGLRLYWNDKESEFLANSAKYTIYSKMQSLIDTPSKHKNVDTVIDINAEFKLITQPDTITDRPLYSLTIELDVIDIHLKHQQLQ